METHHAQGIHHDGVNVRARALVRDLHRVVRDVRPQLELLHAIDDARAVVQRVDKEYIPVRKRRHLRHRRVHRQLADLRRDREEELGPLAHLALHPHVALHQEHEPLRDG